jgi:hypothetical protein
MCLADRGHVGPQGKPVEVGRCAQGDRIRTEFPDGPHDFGDRHVGAEEVGTPAGQSEAVGEHPQTEVVVLVVRCSQHDHRVTFGRRRFLDPEYAGLDNGADDTRDVVLLPDRCGA